MCADLATGTSDDREALLAVLLPTERILDCVQRELKAAFNAGALDRDAVREEHARIKSALETLSRAFCAKKAAKSDVLESLAVLRACAESAGLPSAVVAMAHFAMASRFRSLGVVYVGEHLLEQLDDAAACGTLWQLDDASESGADRIASITHKSLLAVLVHSICGSCEADQFLAYQSQQRHNLAALDEVLRGVGRLSKESDTELAAEAVRKLIGVALLPLHDLLSEHASMGHFDAAKCFSFSDNPLAMRLLLKKRLALGLGLPSDRRNFPITNRKLFLCFEFRFCKF